MSRPTNAPPRLEPSKVGRVVPPTEVLIEQAHETSRRLHLLGVRLRSAGKAIFGSGFAPDRDPVSTSEEIVDPDGVLPRLGGAFDSQRQLLAYAESLLGEFENRLPPAVGPKSDR